MSVLQGAAAMFAEEFIIIERSITQDGAGGFDETLDYGLEFQGAVTAYTSVGTEFREADALTASSTLILAIAPNIPLRHNMEILRVSDNSLYKVIADPNTTMTHPAFVIQEKQVRIEKVRHE